MSAIVILNGEPVPAAEARVSVFDAGFTHGAGLFETMRTYGGRVMRLARHIARMNQSAETLKLALRVDEHRVAQGVEALTAAWGSDIRLRLVATPGDIPRPGAAATETATRADPMWLLTASALARHPPETYEQGLRVCISPYRQNRLDPIAGHKTLGYLGRLLSMKNAAERGCAEALWFTTDHFLAEGAVSNVFIVKDQEIVTPPLDTPVLAGTTREAIIELARDARLEIAERPIDIDALLGAGEVFLTGSTLEVMPVTSIEKHLVGDGQPGPITRRLASAYQDLVRKECDGHG